jgi:lysozyme family protein
MAQFEIAATITMAIEGGYQNSCTDLGGETKYGISKRAFPNTDIKNLTPEKAIDIYRNAFWNQYRIGNIVNQDIANYVFDMFVNMSYADAALAIQRAISQFKSIVVDGIFGTKTIDAINAILDTGRFMDILKIKRITQYLKIADQNPSQSVNLRSWVRRSL